MDRSLSVRRTLTSLAAGLVAGAVVGFLTDVRLLPLVTWTVAVAVLLTWVWRRCWPQDAGGTRRLAQEERSTRSTDAWLITAAVASLAAVVVALLQSSGAKDPVAVASVLLSVVGVALSWALVNTVYAFKYARLHYVDEPGDGSGGSFDFKQDDEPAYSDFTYLAFTVGMSYAVSETEPTSTRARRAALGHALLSYAFGTGVLAVAVNLVTDLGG
ncbi:DUF1345 domain-containing protein [Kineococcus sp. DHX-1]|uniref:DUF1345 domain-containing protein n=1 Tax=Kineococcus sp. DHX-1 TaxID=3349638 RepID=UPI0036D2D3FC